MSEPVENIYRTPVVLEMLLNKKQLQIGGKWLYTYAKKPCYSNHRMIRVFSNSVTGVMEDINKEEVSILSIKLVNWNDPDIDALIEQYNYYFNINKKE